MQLRKAWARFFAYTLLTIGLLSLVMLALFYNSAVGQESARTQIIDDFVRNQKLDLIKNVVNNIIAEVNVQKVAAEKEAITRLELVTFILGSLNPEDYADDRRVGGLIEILGGMYEGLDTLAYNTETGSVLNPHNLLNSQEQAIFQEASLESIKDRSAFERLFEDYASSNIYSLNDTYLIGYGVGKNVAYDIVMDVMQEYADSHIPLGDVQIRIDALHSYDFQGEFATRIIIPFFQKGSEVSINKDNADYYDILPQIVTNGEAYTIYNNGGQFERIIYARLYRPYDWVISSSVSALDIQQLTNMLTEQFRQQQNSYIVLFSLLCLMFTATALTVFIMLGRLFFRKADTELKVMDELTNNDSLTGIYNRRYMDENLEKTMQFLSRTGGKLSVLIVDIDYFKLYNDTYGHGQGDVCLKAIAWTLASSLPRESDFVARYGGEEFVVVLAGTGKTGAVNIAEKLLENVRELEIPHEKNAAAPYVTISIGGTSASPSHTQSWKDYLRTADEALYISKNNGRDRYTYLDFKEETK